MIARLVGAGTALLVYFCAATFLAQLIVGAYLWSAWKMDREKVARMLAAAQGAETRRTSLSARVRPGDETAEQPSLQQVIEARVSKSRDLELRESALKNAVDQVRLEQRRLAEDRAKHQSMVAAFQQELESLKQGAEAAGRLELGRILESLKSKQAKDQIMEMLAKDEIEEVVIILRAIADRPRAKIIAELKTEEENQKLAEVLRRIREGEPEAPLAAQTLSQLNPSSPATAQQ